jgi:hypothetical protein
MAKNKTYFVTYQIKTNYDINELEFWNGKKPR